MLVTDHLKNTTNPLFSVEVVPPRRNANWNNINVLVDRLVEDHQIPFLYVTSHASIILEDGRRGKTNPGTDRLCERIMQAGSQAVPHVICKGYNIGETGLFIQWAKDQGITNIMALTGDVKKGENLIEVKGKVNRYSIDVIRQARRDSFTGDIGVGYYPQGHILDSKIEHGVVFLKAKLDAGADFGIGQICLSYDAEMSFRDQCLKYDLTEPLLAGIKVLTSRRQLISIPKSFYGVTIPRELAEGIERFTSLEKPCTEDSLKFGVNFMAQYIRKLSEAGVPGFQIYAMNKGKSALALLDKLNSC